VRGTLVPTFSLNGADLAAAVVCMLINFTGIDPISALLGSAVINGFLAPPLLVQVMLVANNKKAMGNRVNGLGSNILGWATATGMFAAALVLTFTWFVH
jgi:Mn2+/Fe2+ NRAMP family transporter